MSAGGYCSLQLLLFLPLIFSMSVKLEHITKTYGTQKAVDDVSFSIDGSSIVGFLGPNGAGKTTTMKILSCYIPQTEGYAEVCGYDVVKDPIEVRRNIGYLPEHNPLYLDMYIKEYLHFVARINKVSNARQRISDMIDITGLGREQHKKIGQLSKGYRQRVGLAHAMLHDPKVLILDEPTTGLDPNQLAEIRALIRSLGREKTVLFSSHIMQEVEAICDRVIIINKGEIVADQSTGELQQSSKGKSVYALEFKNKDRGFLKEKISKISWVHQVDFENETVHITAEDDSDHREKLFRFAVDQQLVLLSMNKKENNLEDIFKSLTK